MKDVQITHLVTHVFKIKVYFIKYCLQYCFEEKSMFKNLIKFFDLSTFKIEHNAFFSTKNKNQKNTVLIKNIVFIIFASHYNVSQSHTRQLVNSYVLINLLVTS